MWKLLAYIKEYRRESILGPLFKLLEATFELLVPLVIAAIIDTGIPNADRGYVLRMCGILVLLAIVGTVCAITAQYFAAKASVGFTRKVRTALYRHIQGLSYSDLDTLGVSTLMTRMTSDMNQVQTGVNLTLRLLLRSPFVVFGALVMALIIDAQAALIFAAAIPLLAVVVFFIMLVSIRLFGRAQTRLDGVMGITRENLSGVRVIRAFNREEEEVKEFHRRTASLNQVQRRVGSISALMNPLTYVIINLAIVALIWMGAIRVEAGILTQGMVIALYNYMSQILVELIKLANLIINIAKSIACGNRIQAVFEIKPGQEAPEKLAKEPSGEIAVQMRGVSLAYPGAGAEALSGIDFTVRRGETIGVIGGTGSGKSTLVNLIPRFYDATKGEVLVNGVDVREYPVEELRKKFGIVPQQARLFQGTIRENLKWGREDADDAALLEALETAQASELASQKEGGLDHKIEQGGKNLSGGQRQRLTIARALVRRPEFLILDDSASALDYATDAALRKALKALNDMTVFIVSQRASALMHADRILVLDDGLLVGNSSHDELLKDCSVYREIYLTQFSKGGESA